MIENTRTEGAEELLRRLAAAVRAVQLYSARHPIVARNLELLSEALASIHRSLPSLTIGILGDEVVVGGVPVGRGDTFGDIVRRLEAAGVNRIAVDRDVDRGELTGFIRALATAEPRRGPDADPVEVPRFAHIRVGRIQLEPRVESSLADTATIQRLYADAVTAAADVWESASTEHRPDAPAARRMIDGLAQAVAESRTALLALTALKQCDNYTFTHMVNVSILTMAQARTVGIDGHQLREFGVAGLMHDIGKVRTPTEILQKPDVLSAAEFDIMKRHSIDGAAMLRQTPDMPSLAPVVAFEHHLRLDGTGYPAGVSRRSLNLCTMFCSIADVYDAMRSRRHYQQSFPTERILEVLKFNDGLQFDQHLVRRFVQLVGIYPPGSLVRLDSGDIAVVVRVHAPDPYRPHVRVVADRDGARRDRPYDVSLWEIPPGAAQPSSITAPLDPAEYGIDPLAAM